MLDAMKNSSFRKNARITTINEVYLKSRKAPFWIHAICVALDEEIYGNNTPCINLDF